MQASQELVPHDANQGRASRHHANANLVSMLSGGVLLVRSALVVVACSLPGGALPRLHVSSGASVPAGAALEQGTEFGSGLCRIHKGEGCDIEGPDPILLGQTRYAKHVSTQGMRMATVTDVSLWSATTTMQWQLHPH